MDGGMDGWMRGGRSRRQRKTAKDERMKITREIRMEGKIRDDYRVRGI